MKTEEIKKYEEKRLQTQKPKIVLRREIDTPKPTYEELEAENSVLRRLIRLIFGEHLSNIIFGEEDV